MLISFILVFWNLKAPYGAKHFFKGPKMSEALKNTIIVKMEMMTKKKMSEAERPIKEKSGVSSRGDTVKLLDDRGYS